MFLKIIAIVLLSLQSLYALVPEQHLILDSHQRKIEYYLMKPEGDGPFPALFLLHGHQMPPTSGGRQFIDMGWLDNYFANEQMVVVAISTPGFGESEGTRDFSGPTSQQAVAEVIRHVGEQSFVDPTRMGIYGIGIQWVMVPPAIHVATIIAGSSADLSGKFNVGDVVLSVSPNNDSQEIDVLRMPLPQFSSLLGGKKGSTLRLCIQHFDQTVEYIVLERGPVFSN